MSLIARVGQRTRNEFMARGYIRGIEAISAIGRRFPQAQPKAHGLRVIRDLPYLADGSADHRLDLWIPANRIGRLPVVIYVHGGAFHYLSKETHWLMALSFARAGYVVANVEYRRAPKHAFPAAIEDVCRAAQWVRRNITSFGGDPDRIAFAGESAGANLVTSLTLACCQQREEPWARELFDSGLVPKACLPACGVLQVSDMARLLEGRRLPKWVWSQLEELELGYLSARPVGGKVMELADPLLTLERGVDFARPLPPFFTFAGTRDVLLDDTQRLKVALDRLEVPCELRVYEGEIHAFHAMLNRPATKDVWRGQLAMLDRLL